MSDTDRRRGVRSLLSGGFGQLDLEALLRLRWALQAELGERLGAPVGEESVRRLTVGVNALKVPAPPDLGDDPASQIRGPGGDPFVLFGRINDGIAALQSLDDLGSEANAKALEWMNELQRRADAWRERLPVLRKSPYCDVCCSQLEADGSCPSLRSPRQNESAT